MASVQGKTSIKIDELVNNTVISGSVSSAGDLLLSTRGGAVINAGSVRKPFGVTWKSNGSYVTGDVVGYAGGLWKAKSDNLNKPPALFSSYWTTIQGFDYNAWAEKDPYFDGDSVSENYQLFWKTGNPVVSLTSVAGEFESGIQALKISLAASEGQRVYPFLENIVRGGETITVAVRAKLSAAAAGSQLNAQLVQNDLSGTPEPFQTGVVYPASQEGARSITTSWATYFFTFTAQNAKPRASIQLLVSAGSGAPATFLIDYIKTIRGSNQLLAAWPVGSVYMSVDPTSPAQKFGGTWSAWGTGRAPVGVDTSQTEFNTVEKTGGEKTHLLTSAESGLPDHTHTNGATGPYNVPSGTYYGLTTFSNTGGVVGGAKNASQAHNNLQPYITVYMWKRTA